MTKQESIELTKDERSMIGFALACYIEDTEKAIKKHTKEANKQFAFDRLSDLIRLTYTKIIPDSLCGDMKLPDGTVLKKE